MANWGSVNFEQLQKFQEQLEALANPQTQTEFYNGCAKECAARFLGKVIRKTPVGKNQKTEVKTGEVYKTGKKKGKAKTKKVVSRQGGTLRRGWTANTEEQAESGSVPNATEYASSLTVQKNGKKYSITITNPVHYASYVEKGHRQEPGKYVPAIGKRLKKSWVDGKFFMKKSEIEVKAELPAILNRRLKKFLNGGGTGQ